MFDDGDDDDDSRPEPPRRRKLGVVSTNNNNNSPTTTLNSEPPPAGDGIASDHDDCDNGTATPLPFEEHFGHRAGEAIAEYERVLMLKTRRVPSPYSYISLNSSMELVTNEQPLATTHCSSNVAAAFGSRTTSPTITSTLMEAESTTWPRRKYGTVIRELEHHQQHRRPTSSQKVLNTINAPDNTDLLVVWMGNLSGLDALIGRDFMSECFGDQGFYPYIDNFQLIRNNDETRLITHGLITFRNETAAQACLALMHGERMPGTYKQRKFLLKSLAQAKADDEREKASKIATRKRQQEQLESSVNLAASVVSLNKPELEECAVCFGGQANCVLYTCGHARFCFECAQRIKSSKNNTCPICRTTIVDVIRLYR